MESERCVGLSPLSLIRLRARRLTGIIIVLVLVLALARCGTRRCIALHLSRTLCTRTRTRADSVVTPEVFAQSVVDDYQLAPSYHAVITKSIQDQLSDFKAHTAAALGDEEGNGAPREVAVGAGALEGEEAKWWEGWRKRVRVDERKGGGRKRRKVLVDVDNDREMVPVGVDEIEVDEDASPEEMRILIKVGRVFLLGGPPCTMS